MISCHFIFDGTSQIADEVYAGLKRAIEEVDPRLFTWLYPQIWKEKNVDDNSFSPPEALSSPALPSSKELFYHYYLNVETKRQELSNTPEYADLNNVEEQHNITGSTNPILYLLVNMDRLTDPELRSDFLNKLSRIASRFSRVIILAVENADKELHLELQDELFLREVVASFTGSEVTNHCMVKICLASLGKRFDGSYAVIDSYVNDLARMVACEILPDQLGTDSRGNICIFFREQPHNARIAIMTYGTGHCFFDREKFKKNICYVFRQRLLDKILNEAVSKNGSTRGMSRLLPPMRILDQTLTGNKDISSTVLTGRQTANNMPYLLFPDSTRVQLNFSRKHNLSYKRWLKKKDFLKEVDEYYQYSEALIEKERDQLDKCFEKIADDDRKLLKEEIAELILDSASVDQLDEKCEKLHRDISPWYNVQKCVPQEPDESGFQDDKENVIESFGSGAAALCHFFFFWMLPLVLALLVGLWEVHTHQWDEEETINADFVAKEVNELFQIDQLTGQGVLIAGGTIVGIWILLGLGLQCRTRRTRKRVIGKMDNFLWINLQKNICEILQQIFQRHRENLHRLIDGNNTGFSRMSRERVHKLFELKTKWMQPGSDAVSSTGYSEYYDHFYPEPDRLDSLSDFILKKENFLAEDIQKRFKDKWAELVCQFLEAELTTTSETALFDAADEKMKLFAEELLKSELQGVNFNLLLRDDYRDDKPNSEKLAALSQNLKSDANNLYLRGKLINQMETRDQLMIVPQEINISQFDNETSKVFDSKCFFKDQCFMFVSVLLFNGELFDGEYGG